MKPVIYHSAAEQDILNAAAYYEKQRQGLGAEFRQELQAAMDRLVDRPESFAIEIHDVRRCSVHRFPYSIFFVDESHRIWVLAVAHQHRRPRYWSKRRPS